MTFRNLLTLTVVLVPIVCGCANPTDPSDDANVALGTLRAVIDGVPYTDVATGTRTYSPNASNPLTFVTGNYVPGLPTTGPRFIFGFGAVARVGTTTLAASNTFVVFTSYDADGAVTGRWGGFGSTGSGSVTIRTLTPTGASGTFFFTLPQVNGSTAPKVITDGAFNVTSNSVDYPYLAP